MFLDRCDKLEQQVEGRMQGQHRPGPEALGGQDGRGAGHGWPSFAEWFWLGREDSEPKEGRWCKGEMGRVPRGEEGRGWDEPGDMAQGPVALSEGRF